MSEGSRWRARRKARVSLAGFSLGLALLTGCLVGPDFTRPAPPAVAGYLPKSDSAAPETAAEGGQSIEPGEVPAKWWGLFHCARLDDVLRDAIRSSHSLAAARATLAQAREEVIAARSAFFPQLDLGASARRGTSESGDAGSSTVANLFSVGPVVGFSIDVFGGTRRHVEQQQALAENERDELAAAYLSLTGNAVIQAISIASLRFQISTVEDLIRNDEKNFDLVRREFDAGKVARTDVLTAQAQLEADRTQLPSLRQQESVARHALAVLAARAPGEWDPPDFSIDEFTLPERLPLSLPSELVRQRPDILSAESRLHADSAAIGVATAQMYPSITISASLVQDAASLANLFRSASRVWSIGAAGDAPVSRGGALGAQRQAAIDAYDSDREVYQQTVLAAFGQVADSLTAIEHDGEAVAASLRAVDIASSSLILQRSSYAAGRSSALQLIVAENTYSSVRLGYVRALGQRLADSAELFVAVGGGAWWEDPAVD